jgi:hypothetical protein
LKIFLAFGQSFQTNFPETVSPTGCYGLRGSEQERRKLYVKKHNFHCEAVIVTFFGLRPELFSLCVKGSAFLDDVFVERLRVHFEPIERPETAGKLEQLCIPHCIKTQFEDVS